MVEKEYLLTPYNKSLAYGKAKLSLIVNESVTADYVKKYFEDRYVSSKLWKKLLGQDNSIAEETVLTLPFKEVKSISTLNAVSTQRVDLLSTDVVMGIISKFEKAVQISTQAYNLFMAAEKEAANKAAAEKAAADEAGMTLNEYIANMDSEDVDIDVALASTTTTVAEIKRRLSTTMHDIYLKNFNDESDLSLYELSNTNGSFDTSSILFTTRLGPFELEFNESIEYLVNNASKEREGRFMDAYATEFGIEMLQNSLLPTEEYDPDNTQTPFSCGFMIIKNPVSGKIQNIRLYSSYVLNGPVITVNLGKKGILAVDTPRLVISSGVNLFDFLDIAQFYEGVSSSHFSILMMNICDTLNRTNLDGFTETNTTWEFGPLATFDRLKCVNSVYNPSWTGQLINECILAGTTVNIPRRLYYIVEYLNTEFSTLQDNQTIIISFADGAQKVVSIIQIHKTGSITTFQTKDARIDNLFPQNEINADTLIKGELQVANYKGDTIMHVDPTTSSVTIMGKLGINQELHEIKGMIDVDNLSNTNMKHFIDTFTPFIQDTIQSMTPFPTQQSIENNDVLDNITTYILPLKQYSLIAALPPLSRAERFGRLQAIVELPVRMFVIIDAYEILKEYNNNIIKLTRQIQKLESEKSIKIEKEEDAEKWALAVDIALVGFVFVTAVASSGTAPILTEKILAGMSIAANEIDSRTNLIEYIKTARLDGLTSEEIQQLIDTAISSKNSLQRQVQTQTETIDGLIEDIDTQASLLGMGEQYKQYLESQIEFLNCTEFIAVTFNYTTIQINDVITKIEDRFNRFTGYDIPDVSFSRISGSVETIQKEINAILNVMDENPFIVNMDLFTDMKNMLADMKIEKFINMYLGKTSNVPDDMRNFINTMKSHSSYNKDTESHIFLPGYFNILGNNLVNVRNSINTGTSDIVNDTIVSKQKTYRTTESILDMINKLDDAQLYYNTEAYRYEVYQYIKANYSVIGNNPGNYHTLNEYCSRTGDKDDRTYHMHLDVMVAALRSAMPTRYGIDAGSLLDSFGQNVGKWSRLNQFGGKVSIHFDKLIQNQLPFVNVAKDTLETLRLEYNSYTDELQDYVDTQNWDIETHNRLQLVISAWLKMFTIYGGENKFAVVVPVTDKTNNVGSIYYLKAFIKKDDNKNPTLLLSGRSLNIDEYTRDLSYRETLYTLVSALTSSSQLINYCTLFLEKDIDTAITDKIQSDALFTDRFDGTSLFVSVVDITNQKVIQNEEYAYWKGQSFDQVYLPNTNTTMSDIYKNTNANFKEQYGFDPSSLKVKDDILENVYIAPTKYDDTWRLVVMRFIVKTDNDTQDKTIYRVSCNINVNEYINQSIISRGDTTLYGDLTVKTSADKEIFQIDTLNKTVSSIYPLGIGSQNPTTMLDINDTSISNINRFIDTMSSKMKDLKGIHRRIDDKNNGNLIFNKIRKQITENLTKTIAKTDKQYKYSYDSMKISEEEYEVKLNAEPQRRDENGKPIIFEKGMVDFSEWYLWDADVTARYRQIYITRSQVNPKTPLGYKSYLVSMGRKDSLKDPTMKIILEEENNYLKAPSGISYTVNKLAGRSTFINSVYEYYIQVIKYYYVTDNTTLTNDTKTLLTEILERIDTQQFASDTKNGITLFTNKIMSFIQTFVYNNNMEVTDQSPIDIYELSMDTTDAEDIRIIYSSQNPEWAGRTFNDLLNETGLVDTDKIAIQNHVSLLKTDFVDKQNTDGSVCVKLYPPITSFKHEVDNEIMSYIQTFVYTYAEDTDRKPYYIYDLSTDTKNAEDIRIIYSSQNTKWTGYTFKKLLEDNIDNDLTNIIKQNIIPYLQDILDKQLLYDGSVYTTLYQSVNGDNYTVNTVFEMDNKLLVLGSGIDIQQFNININNPNVSKLLNKITQNINSLNYTYYNYISSSINVQNVFGYDETQEYISLLKTQGIIFDFDSVYTLVPSVKNLLDNKVNGIEIKNATDNLKKELHTSFLVNYTKNDSTSLFGIVNARDNNNDYVVFYYKYTGSDGSTKLQTYYLNITEKLFVSSVSLNGDMSITGQLELYKNTTEKEKFIIIDPENSYLGINTNDRFLNYELEYQTTSSIYNSKQHVVAFSDSYPNVAFERQSETKEDSNDPDYSRFGSYSSSTMVRVSKLWDYDDIMKRVDLLNGSNELGLSWVVTTIDNIEYVPSKFKWQFHRTYGPDISFEIKDKSDVNTELGQLKMVIDKREDNKIHAGFGVQVVDTTLSSGFEGSLKNILYVNNDSQLFVEGVWLGGKLFRVIGNTLHWGDNIVVTKPNRFKVANRAELKEMIDKFILNTNDSEVNELVSNPNLWDVSLVTDMSNLFSDAAEFNQDISAWDVSNVTDMSSMFSGASAFAQDISAWDVSSVKDMSSMFYGATAFNRDIGKWTVSDVTDMSSMFYGATTFNQDIGKWTVSSVTDMSSMFYNAAAFNQDIGEWTVSSVKDMSSMFYNAAAFNQDIGKWTVTYVGDMSSMFSGATAFNTNISEWDCYGVEDMSSMFYNASAFNQDISRWTVTYVTDMSSMFSGTTSFNQDISKWIVDNVTDMSSMFSDATSFNQDISKWTVNNVTNMSSMFYNAAAFNQNIRRWNTLNVDESNYEDMFKKANAFNSVFYPIIPGYIIEGTPFAEFFNFIKIDTLSLIFNITNSPTKITLPISGSDDLEINVNWGDDVINNELTNTYYSNSLYIVIVKVNSGEVTQFGSNNKNSWEGNQYLTQVKTTNSVTWGLPGIISFENAFNGCTSLTQVPTEIPSTITNMNSMFKDATSFQQNIRFWTVNSNNTTTVNMFDGSPYYYDNYYDNYGANPEDNFFNTVTTLNFKFVINNNNTNITLPISGNDLEINVIWGDGTNNNKLTNTYEDSGTYDVTLEVKYGTVSHFGSSEWEGCDKLIEVTTTDDNSWGLPAITSLASAFDGCTLLTKVPTKIPNTVTNTMSMFKNASKFDGDITDWDVSNINTMIYMFYDAKEFNQNISKWDVSKVIQMDYMFTGALKFDQYIRVWNNRPDLTLLKPENYKSEVDAYTQEGIFKRLDTDNNLAMLVKYSSGIDDGDLNLKEDGSNFREVDSNNNDNYNNQFINVNLEIRHDTFEGVDDIYNPITIHSLSSTLSDNAYYVGKKGEIAYTSESVKYTWYRDGVEISNESYTLSLHPVYKNKTFYQTATYTDKYSRQLVTVSSNKFTFII